MTGCESRPATAPLFSSTDSASLNTHSGLNFQSWALTSFPDKDQQNTSTHRDARRTQDEPTPARQRLRNPQADASEQPAILFVDVARRAQRPKPFQTMWDLAWRRAPNRSRLVLQPSSGNTRVALAKAGAETSPSAWRGTLIKCRRHSPRHSRRVHAVPGHPTRQADTAWRPSSKSLRVPSLWRSSELKPAIGAQEVRRWRPVRSTARKIGTLPASSP